MGTMKKSLASIFIGFLVLLFCQPAHADSKSLRVQNGLILPVQAKNLDAPSTLGRFSTGKAIALPASEKATGSEWVKRVWRVFPLLDTLFSTKSLRIEKVNTWHEYPGYGKIQNAETILYKAPKTFASRKLGSQDHLGISLDRRVGLSKAWKLSLDVGIDLRHGPDIASETGGVTEAVSVLQTEWSRQKQDLSDPLRGAASFIGLGITCRF